MVLAACDDRPSPPDAATSRASPSAAAGASAFSSELGEDISGYYMPATEIRAGDWVLRDLFIGQTPDFRNWESGARRGAFAPVMLEFEDVTSPMTSTELGEVRSGQTRVLPTRYQVTDDAVIFTGRADGLGEVRFRGRLDGEALATARRNLGDESPVLTGTLTVGGRTFAGTRFRWWAGD